MDLQALLAGSAAGPVRGELAVIVRAGGVRLCLEVDAADVVLRGDPMPVPRDAAMPWARAVMRYEGVLVPLLDLGALGARLTETGQA